MVKPAANSNNIWSDLIIEELIRHSCCYFCISPGSRSTPLTVAVAHNKKAISKVFYDERGAAFHALGFARATGKPAVLICTSGTAAANYYPAIIEAHQDSIPLIILTADRPPELRATAANQTIDQVKMFGNYVNWYFELPVPDENISPQFALTTVDQAYFKSMHPQKGPIHINCMFREPFLSEKQNALTEEFLNWQNSGKPYTSYPVLNNKLLPDLELFEKINRTKHGIIVAGKLDNNSDSEAVLEFAKKSGFPIFADITSGLRVGYKSDSIIEYFDLMLLSETFNNSLEPDLIIQFGKRFVSKRLLTFLSKLKPKNYLVVDESTDRFDPAHIVSHRIVGNISQFCKSYVPSNKNNIDKVWNEQINKTNKIVGDLINSEFNSNIKLSEISIARIISQNNPENSGLYLASSMPVRDMDMFAEKRNKNIYIASNRGASGIDGTIASAIGFAEGKKTAVTLVIGDLAFIHDLNSLYQLTSSKYPVTIVLLNNSGGGIFSFLTIADQKDVFEKYFSTPHDLTFNSTADLFKLKYYRPQNSKEFIDSYKSAIVQKKSAIIEISIDKNDNFKLHKNFYNKVIKSLEK